MPKAYPNFQFSTINFQRKREQRCCSLFMLNYTVGWLAASMILTNFSGTREAPPIRPPSMSG